MPVEIKGQQLRIRIRSPNMFKTFYYPKLKKKVKLLTHDVGEKGKLQFIRGKLKSTGKWANQAVRLNLSDYDSLSEIVSDLNVKEVNKTKRNEAEKLAASWWWKHGRRN